jgi:hypothetical protein
LKELINHFVFDTVSLQIVAVVLLAFALSNWRGHVQYAENEPPRTFAGVSVVLAFWLFVLVAGVASYYGAPIRMTGKIAVWALHVGLIAFARLLFVKPHRHGLRSFLDDAARFEAIASLGVLFLK